MKFFRTLISLQDTFYHAQITHNNTFDLIINIIYDTMPRDNLLNSACLELFEFIRRENIKPIITHVVEKYREKLKTITYVDTFHNLILRFDQMQGYGADGDSSLFSQEDATPPRSQINGQRLHGLREMDAAEEEYFNGSDDEDEVWHSMDDERIEVITPGRFELTSHLRQGKYADEMVITPNGSASPNVKPLVDYPDDDDDDMKTEPDSAARRDTLQNMANQAEPEAGSAPEATMSPVSSLGGVPPPERLSEKRRREEDEDEDELVKLSSDSKRRSSSVGVVPGGGGVGFLGRRKSVTSGSASTSPSSGSEKGHGPIVPSSPKSKGAKGKQQIAISFGTSSRIKAANKKPTDAQNPSESHGDGQSVGNGNSAATDGSNGGNSDTKKTDDGVGDSGGGSS